MLRDNFLGFTSMTARGRDSEGWGTLSAPTQLKVVKRSAAILLINGYNVWLPLPHPEQWWSFRDESQRTIPCQIRDEFFFHGAGHPGCLPTNSPLADPPRSGVNCNVDPDQGGGVCVVDNLNGEGDIDDNVRRVESYVSAHSWLQDVGGYILIGHSYGGQISRMYAARHPEKVIAVITIDTPYFGAGSKAYLGWLVKKYIAEMSEGIIDDEAIWYQTGAGAAWLNLGIALETGSNNAAIPTHAISSEVLDFSIDREDLDVGLALDPSNASSFKGPSSALSLRSHPTATLRSIGSDNVVPTDSQEGQGVTNVLTAEALGFRQRLDNKFSLFDNLHNRLLEEEASWQRLFDYRLKSILAMYRFSLLEAPTEYGGKDAHAAQAEALGPPELPGRAPVQVVKHAEGKFEPSSDSATLEFDLDQTQDLVINVVSTNSNATVSLNSPANATLEAANIDGLTTFYSSSTTTLGTHEMVLVREPLEGAWSLSLIVPSTGGTAHVPAPGSSWKATVTARSPLALSAWLGDATYLSGETGAVYASLDVNGANLTGSTVWCEVRSEAGMPVATLALQDDGLSDDGAAGDGVYGGSFTTGDPGEYTVVVTASGSSLLGNFDRQAVATFSVGARGSTISGPFMESAPDADGDGRYDSLDWSFAASLPAAGDYTCLGDLLATDGSFVTQAIARVTADAGGTYPVTLSFSGLEIYRKAKLGPYTLSNLRVTGGTPEGERLSGRLADTVVSGGPYWSWMSFQRDVDPQLTWVRPAGEEAVAGNSVELQWNVFDGNGAMTLDLYYDTTGSSFSGTPIVTGLASTQGTMTYTWDMSGLPDSVYFVYARVRNGEYSDAIYGGSFRRLLDSDGDGLPDTWETAHGLNPSSSADAYLDPDGDGLSNFDEYPNGTDPQDADTDHGGESDLSEAVNGRDGTDPADDVTSLTLVSVSPGEGDSRGDEQVLVLGSGFQNGATVDFGGAASPEVTFVNSTRLVVTTPAHPLGTVDVTVSNPGGGSAGKTGAFAFLCEFVEPPVAFSNAAGSPLCAGQDLQLGASGLSAASFSWTGPNGFTSSLQNPMISQAGAAASGSYTVTLQIGSCSLQATTDVLVRTLPTALASGDQALCPESSASIQASLTGEAPWTLQWSDGFSQSGVTTSPVTRLVSPAADTTYSITSISDAHCAGTASGAAAITINGTCTMYHTVSPCRVADTRGPVGDNGGPALAGGATRAFNLGGRCGIPATAKAVSLNLAVTGATSPGYLTLYRPGDPLPLMAAITFAAGQTRTNNAIARLGAGGMLATFAGQPAGSTVHVIVDVTGYFE